MAVTQSKQTYNGANHRIQGRRLDTVGGAYTLSLNFTVRYFQLVNLTQRITYEWYEGMANGTTLKTVAAGTRTLDTADVAISVDAGSGDQDGSGGTPDTTNAGVDNNTAYPGPSTVVNSTATAIPGIEPSGQVSISATAAGAASDQFTWVAQG